MKYWAYVNNEILGPFEKDKLLELPTFSPSLLVCPQTPVGEKTEDWKEASSYPELSALAGGAMHSGAMPAPQPAPAPVPEPAPQAFPQPAIEPVSLAFKPLTAAQSVEPMAPPTHTDGMANITVNKLGKSGIASSAPSEQPAAVAQASSGFDPISLSTIIRRSENLSGQDTPAPAPAPEGLALEPRGAQPAPEPAQSIAEPPAFTPEPAAPAPQPSSPPVIEREDFPSAVPAQAPAAAAPGSFDTAGLQKLIQRLDDLSKVSATRKDVDSALDPVRFKLDQMGEVISSIKNSQFQREVMDKLSYLENAVGELKAGLRGGAPAPAPAKPQEVKFESNSDTIFGVQPAPAPKPAEKPAPAKEAAPPQEIKDEGTKKSNVGAALKKVFKLIITLVLLAAVLLGTVIGLKNFGVFDATKFLPFPLPFLGGGQSAAQQQPPPAAADPFSGEQAGAQAEQPVQSPAAEPASPTPEQQEALRKATQAQAQALQDKRPVPVPPEAVPEVIYITRTYKTAPAGQSLENKIYEHAGKSGGNYNKTNWSVRSADGGKFEIDALIPAKTSMLTYTFLVDREKKSVQPLNEPAKEAFAALSAPPARAAKAAKKAAARPAPAPKKKAAPKADEEYEYVYEDETE